MTHAKSEGAVRRGRAVEVAAAVVHVAAVLIDAEGGAVAKGAAGRAQVDALATVTLEAFIARHVADALFREAVGDGSVGR